MDSLRLLYRQRAEELAELCRRQCEPFLATMAHIKAMGTRFIIEVRPDGTFVICEELDPRLQPSMDAQRGAIECIIESYQLTLAAEFPPGGNLCG